MSKMDLFYMSHEEGDEIELAESDGLKDGEIPPQLVKITNAVIEACARNGDLLWLADVVESAIAHQDANGLVPE